MDSRWQTTINVVKILFVAPVFALGIAAENKLKSRFRLRFPRCIQETEQCPEAFFTLIRHQPHFANDDAIVRVIPRGGPDNEPDKALTSGMIDVVTRTGSDERTTRLFLKFQNGRGMPLWLQAIRAAVEWGIAREVEFYRRLATSVPLQVGTPLYVDYVPACNRVCLVLEYIEGLNIPDWRGCPVGGMRAMLRDVARMNAAFLGQTASDSRTQWIPARTGLDFAAFVSEFIKGQETCFKEIWSALQKRFVDEPLTLVHGDCRPGNMLFIDDGQMKNHLQSNAESKPSEWEMPFDQTRVVFLDWEATNAAPLLWDFTYGTTLGLTVADRRLYRDRLLSDFLKDLQEHGVPPALCDPKRSHRNVQCLTLVLSFVAYVVITHGFWDKQGNTGSDATAWKQRISTAVLDLDVDVLAEALGIPTGLLLRFQDIVRRNQ